VLQWGCATLGPCCEYSSTSGEDIALTTAPPWCAWLGALQHGGITRSYEVEVAFAHDDSALL